MDIYGGISKSAREGAKQFGVNCYACMATLLSTGVGMIRVRCGVWPGGAKMRVFFMQPFLGKTPYVMTDVRRRRCRRRCRCHR